jgi:hypothetical protein
MLVFLLIITITDDLIFKTEQDIDLELILKDLEDLKSQPLDINSATIEDLAKIPYLTSNSAIKIVEFRGRYGLFRQLDDLLKIRGFDRVLVETIRPFVTVGIKRVDVKKIAARFRSQTELPRQDQSPEYYTRFGFSLDQYSVHVVTEKDAYENEFFDHYAAGLFVDDGVRKFALGKYNLDVGAGAALSTVGSFFRGIDFRIMLNERGLIPYTSTIENGGFFGAAFSDSFFVNYKLFYSNQRLDGRIDSLGYARSLDPSGDHVDSLSRSRKDQINEEIYGYDVRYRWANASIANRSYFCNYRPAFATADSHTKFYGDDFFITSIEFRYFGESFVMFSEVARAWENRVGGVFGFSTSLPYVDLNLAGKYFPEGFYSPKGIEADDDLAAAVLDLKHHSRIVDVGAVLTLDNRLSEDTTRYDLKFSFAKRLGMLNARFNIRRRYRAERRDLSGSEALLRFMITRFLFFDFRFEERSIYDEQVEKGIFGALEVGLDLKKLDVRARYGIFDTDSYGSRIYAYEIDLPGVLNNRMLYGDGDYELVYVSLRPVPQIKLSMKYSAVHRDPISDRQIGGQIDFRF